MKVKAPYDCNILGEEYTKGEVYDVSDGDGQMLLRNGFKLPDEHIPDSESDEVSDVMYSRSRKELNRMAEDLGITGPEKLPNMEAVAREIIKRR